MDKNETMKITETQNNAMVGERKMTKREHIDAFRAAHPVWTKVIIGGFVTFAAGVGYAVGKAIKGNVDCMPDPIVIEASFEPEEDIVSEDI